MRDSRGGYITKETRVMSEYSPIIYWSTIVYALLVLAALARTMIRLQRKGTGSMRDAWHGESIETGEPERT